MIDFAKEEKSFQETLAHFEAELKNLRTGRAHISMVEDIIVDVYGSKMPLKHVAAISTPDARSIFIKPWDKTNLGPIEQAVIKSNLGLAPIADKDQIRISIPFPTEERRRDMAKILSKKLEETRISVRRHRDEIWKTIQDDEREGRISEDQKFQQKEKMEKLVEEFNKKIADIASKKEKEIMEI